MNGLVGALQFLTRLPVHTRRRPDLGACAPWFPVAGALIGAAIGAVAAGLGELLPVPVAATVAVVFGVALTGAFHEDGLADTADAMGGWSPEQRREILKDSRHGSYGVAALCGSIVLRVVTVAALVGPALAFAALVAAHTVGRGCALATMRFARPTAVEGLGADFARSVTRSGAVAGCAAAAAIGAAAVGWWVAPAIAVAAIGSWAVAAAAGRALDGVSGDVLGAVEQVAECLVLVVISGLAVNHSLWWS